MAMKISISMPARLAEQAEYRRQQLGLAKLSEYFQQLTRKDIASVPTI